MAKSEKSMRRRVVRALRDLHAVSVENAVGPGTPDVNFAGGWIELKSVPRWPRDPRRPLRVPHLRPEQRIWLERREDHGGKVYLLLRVGRDWLLFYGWQAANVVGFAPKDELIGEWACKVWYGYLDEEDLLRFLKFDGSAYNRC